MNRKIQARRNAALPPAGRSFSPELTCLLGLLILLLAGTIAAADLDPLAADLDIRFPAPPFIHTIRGPFNFDRLQSLTFTSRFEGSAGQDLWLVFFVRTEDHLQFQASRAVRLRPGRERTTTIQMAPAANELEPCGHFTPWNEYAAANVALAGFKCYSTGFARGKLSFSGIKTVRSTGQRRLHVYDLNALTRSGRLRVTFIPSRLPAGLDDRIEISGVLYDEKQRALQERQGYAYQDFAWGAAADTAHLRKKGPLRYAIDFTPPAPGPYTCRIVLAASDGPALASEVFPVRFDTPAPRPVPPSAIDFSGFVPEGSLTRLSQGTWSVPASRPDLARVWSPVLQWKDGWDYFHGLGRLNQHRMFLFDAFLDAQPDPGIILLTDERELTPNHDFHWDVNPLNRALGGPLARPSEFFANAETVANTLRLAAYSTARWGHHPAVTGMLVTHTMPSPDAAAWNAELGELLAEAARAGTPVYNLHPQPGEPEELSALATTGGWRIQKDIPHTARGRLVYRPQNLTIKGTFPGELPLARSVKGNWAQMNRMSFTVESPSAAPPHMRVMVYLRDQYWNWYEKLLSRPLLAGDKVTYIIALAGDTDWDTPQSNVEWMPYTPLRIREVGIRIMTKTKTPAPLSFNVSDINVYRVAGPAEGADLFQNIKLSKNSIPVYERLDISFAWRRKYKNPFDPDPRQGGVSIDAEFKAEGRPGHYRKAVPGFFYQPFKRSLERKGREKLTAAGPSSWNIRFTPTVPGKHTCIITVKDAHGTYRSKSLAFTAMPSDKKGFVRTDGRYFAFDSGDFFYPIGMTIRSPSDSRMPYTYAKAQPVGKGTYAYDHYFDKLKEHSMNWCRVWMCSWWCGLEWRDDWASYGGIGYYNLENAWRFDYVVEEAAKRGIYLQVDTMNHGQLSLDVDNEWPNSPYNRKNGGPLKMPKEYLTRPDMRRAHKNKLRYTIARWGYSPHIMQWLVLTEVEFTQDYHENNFSNNDTKKMYKDTTTWHKIMAGYMKDIDPWEHMVGTHFSHPQRGAAIWDLKEIDVYESNAYTAFQNLGAAFRLGKPQTGVVEAVSNYHRVFRVYPDGHKRPDKPILIGEYGGHWSKNSKTLLNSELHCGIWASLMTPLAGNTGFWWWPHVDFENRYFEYRAAAQFMAGEDLRSHGFRRDQLRHTTPGQTASLALRSADGRNRWGWIYAPQIVGKILWVKGFNTGEGPQLYDRGIQIAKQMVEIRKVPAGEYKLEYWDTNKGVIIKTRPISIAKSGANILLAPPSFRNDIAFKLYPTDRPQGRGRGSTSLQVDKLTGPERKTAGKPNPAQGPQAKN